MKSINVVVVESHQHALEHFHSAIRRFKVFTPWSMIHFDAHPDLACPRCPAAACFSPRQKFDCLNCSEVTSVQRNLYEFLDLSVSGIAEWIIPLVIAAELRTITWIKPTVSSQFPIGRYLYQVGAYDDLNTVAARPVQSFLDFPVTAGIKTDYDIPYYQDDDAVVQPGDLLLPQTMELVVTELSVDKSTLTCDQTCNKIWALDICLDYFACCNPFLSDIDKVDVKATHALVTLMRGGQGQVHRNANLKKIVSSVISSSSSDLHVPELLDQLAQFFRSSETARKLIDNLKAHTDSNAILKKLVLKAIPNWDMPHDVSSANRERILESIVAVEKALMDCQSVPFIITICRSSDDEFTPPSVVQFIQKEVLELLNRIFCRSGSKYGTHSLRIVRDYGEWEGSTI